MAFSQTRAETSIIATSCTRDMSEMHGKVPILMHHKGLYYHVVPPALAVYSELIAVVINNRDMTTRFC